MRQDIHDLLKYLMGKTDPTDEKCAALCYRLYGLLQKENFYLGEFMAALEEAGEEREVPSETEKKKWTKSMRIISETRTRNEKEDVESG